MSHLKPAFLPIMAAVLVAGAAAALFSTPCAFASPGGIIWDTVYSSKAGVDNDRLKGIALDEQGNLAVTGTAQTRDGNSDYLTVKYGPYGTNEWSGQYDYSWTDIGRAVAYTRSGDLIIAGSSFNMDNPRDSYSGTYYTDYRILKVNSSNALVFEATASGYKKSNEPASVAVDEDGSIYVTGSARNAGDTMSLYYTVKFDTEGRVIWERLENFDGDSHATAVRVGKDGKVVVTGWYKDSASDSFNIRTVRYTSNGEKDLDVQYNKETDNEKAYGLAIDGDGNILVAGETTAENGSTALLLKYTPKGDLVFAEKYKGARYSNRANAVAVDKQGRAYLAGKMTTGEQQGEYILLVYAADGRLLDSKTYAFDGESSAEDVAVDVYGNVILAGTVTGRDQLGVYRLIRVEGWPARLSQAEPEGEAPGIKPRDEGKKDYAGLISPDRVFKKDARLSLTQVVPMVRKVSVKVTRQDGRAALLAMPQGMPGNYEFRFYQAGKGSAHHWEKMGDYSGQNFIVMNPSPKEGGKIMVEVRQKGSPLNYEARQIIDMDELFEGGKDGAGK
ncbi:MAG TPA: hypothetical protein VGK71_06520 [Nitrospirota bacterium]